MVDWFRSWHGAPTDKKLKVCARNANVTLSNAIALWWVLLDAASQHDPRGNVGNLDAEDWAVEIDEDIEKTRALIEAFIAKNLINQKGNVTSWDKRQTNKEDATNAERQKRYRERHGNGVTRNVTPRNASVTPRREEKRSTPCSPPEGDPTRDPTILDGLTDQQVERVVQLGGYIKHGVWGMAANEPETDEQAMIEWEKITGRQWPRSGGSDPPGEQSADQPDLTPPAFLDRNKRASGP